MALRIRLFSLPLSLLSFILYLLFLFHGTAQADWKARWQSTLAAARKEGKIKVRVQVLFSEPEGRVFVFR